MQERDHSYQKWKKGLSRTRSGLFARLFGGAERVDEEFFETLEEAMILADMGMDTTEKLLCALRDDCKEKRNY